MIWAIVVCISLELVAHLACRLFLGEVGYRRLHIWVKEAIGISILLGVVTGWALVTRPGVMEVLAGTWGAALGTGLALGAAHWLYSWLNLVRLARENAAIIEALREARRDQAA
jgi:hypothetical protein